MDEGDAAETSASTSGNGWWGTWGSLGSGWGGGAVLRGLCLFSVLHA